eukprot:TRINITY_DN6556_c0_g1_i1.p2 TRINITY_DN6556_c0_g1~~TRINITY_DN6556_c0_g1_i1.p2  ORF type:complete len:146 (+),score=21.59 TRINITY_DN6556_c0_g1_i1:1246-1683(+)
MLPADQGHIKRPLNCFMLFSREMRPKLRALYPTEHNSVINSRLGQAWSALSHHEKLVYRHKAQQHKEEHQRQYPNYRFQPKKSKKSLAKPSRQGSQKSLPLRSFDGGHKQTSTMVQNDCKQLNIPAEAEFVEDLLRDLILDSQNA